MVELHSRAGAGGRGHSPAPRVQSGMWLTLRLLVSVVCLLYVMQAVLAGQFLSGTYAALSWHQILALTGDGLVVTAIVVAILLRWPGRGPVWPLVSVILLFTISQFQSLSGADRVISLHIPLGTAMIVLIVFLTVRVWRPMWRERAVRA